MIHLFVEFCHHHRLDNRQQFGHGERWDAQCVTEGQRRRHVPADDGPGQDAKLATEASDKVPDLPAFKGGGSVQSRRAVFARRFARLAVSLAPAERPFGEGAETFFSASRINPRAI